MAASEARAALLAALGAMTPSLPVASTNTKYSPTVGQAYQRADVLFAEPDNAEFGSNWQERGFLQVGLCYPVNSSLDDTMTRIDALRVTFARGQSFTNGSTTVTVNRTPTVLPGQVDGSFFVTPVRIPFTAS
jgi:hypothetical protein